MHMHELLWVVKGLHDFSERAAENKGPWLWPTFELLSENVRANREVMNPEGWRGRLHVARERGLVVIGPCTGHCHARHIIVTALGAARLALMNQQGCSRACASRASRECACVERGGQLHLERRLRQRAA